MNTGPSEFLIIFDRLFLIVMFFLGPLEVRSDSEGRTGARDSDMALAAGQSSLWHASDLVKLS